MKAMEKAQIEPWNAQAHQELRDINEPLNWFLLADIEVLALLEDIVPTAVKNRLKVLKREVLEVPR